MAAVRALLAVVLLCAAVPASADSVATWRSYVAEASLRYNVPIAWIERVMRIESRGKNRLRGRPVVSAAGAMGLMQLMPRTWARMRALAGLGSDPFDPRDNILAGTLYLRLLFLRFGYPGLFAAYDAGPGRYLSYLSGRRALPQETVRYQRLAVEMPVATTAAFPIDALFARTPAPAPVMRSPVPGSPLFAIRNGG